MLDHVSLGVSDLERSRRFYDAVLLPLGIVRIVDFEQRGSDYGAMAGSLGVEFTITTETTETMTAPGMHVCFRAPDRVAVQAFHAAALASGGRSDGQPGLRPQYHRITLPPSCLILTGIGSKLCAMRRKRQPRCDNAGHTRPMRPCSLTSDQRPCREQLLTDRPVFYECSLRLRQTDASPTPAGRWSLYMFRSENGGKVQGA